MLHNFYIAGCSIIANANMLTYMFSSAFDNTSCKLKYRSDFKPVSSHKQKHVLHRTNPLVHDLAFRQNYFFELKINL